MRAPRAGRGQNLGNLKRFIFRKSFVYNYLPTTPPLPPARFPFDFSGIWGIFFLEFRGPFSKSISWLFSGAPA
jgi:hypothetical protein